MEDIVEKRGNKSYESLEDLLFRVDMTKVTKKSLELLIKCGAMDAFGRRSALLAVMPEVYDKAIYAAKKKSEGQVSLFGDMEESEPSLFRVSLPDIPESTERLAWEKEILGIYTSSHPMLDFTQMQEMKSITKIGELREQKGKKNVKAVGIITNLKRILTKKDGKPMAFATFEDLTGKVELVVFPNAYEKHRDKLLVDTPVIVKGSVDVKADMDKKEEVKFFLDDIMKLDDKYRNKEKKMDKKIVVKVKSDPTLFTKLKELIRQNPGKSSVQLVIDTNGKVSELTIKDTVDLSDMFIKEITALIGNEYRIE